jgi:nicotinate dehydrogenase subunit B
MGRCAIANECGHQASWRSLDARRWHREGRLHAGRYFSWSWTYGGEPSGNISVRTARSTPSRQCLSADARSISICSAAASVALILAGSSAARNARATASSICTPPILRQATPNLPHIPLLAAGAAGIPQQHGYSTGLITGNGYPPYDMPNMQLLVHWLKDAPLRTSNLRAPGKIGNVMAVESFMDELAFAAGKDPLEFRLSALKNPRGLEVLRKVGEMMLWEPRANPRRDGKGRGVAYTHYKNNETLLAMGMDVEVDAKTGAIRVLRVACAHDCGQIIAPDGVRAQVEGCILQTISRTLFEEVKFDTKLVTSTDWVTYPILTIPDAPALDIALIDRPSEPPMGVGEASASPVAAAIANAVFDATGVRLRRVPFTPERVKQALEGAPPRAG